jgi:hypothetical protein
MDFQIERVFKGPGFAETLYLCVCNGQRIIRKVSNPDARAFSRTALVREIRLLLGLPSELKPFFPEVIRTNLGSQAEDSPDLPDIIFYDMPYYPPEDGWVTLSTSLLEGGINMKEAHRVLGEILDTAFLYFTLDNCEPAGDYAETTMLRAIRESLAFTAKDNDLCGLLNIKNWRISGRSVCNFADIEDYFQDTSRMRSILTPQHNRFLHGDFFPENILYNRKLKRWILLDPVSVRGVHRGDFVLDINKMDDWLSGELPALRMGRFAVDVNQNNVEFAIHTRSGELDNLHQLGLTDWYKERLTDPSYAGVFSREPGWELRYLFVKVFYSTSMLPLADKQQAVARYFLALRTMAEFIERLENR